jgi:glycogen debranching enzyme
LAEAEIAQPFYITTTSRPADDRPRVLKYGDLFAVFNRHGDIEPSERGEQGLFYEGTRFLSELLVSLGNGRPLLLSSTISQDNFLFSADLTNVDVLTDDGIQVPRGTIHLHRSKFLQRGLCYDKLRVANYGLSVVSMALAVTFQADFADIFEVRGTERAVRGTELDPVTESNSVTLRYEGLDGVTRTSRLTCSPAPERIGPSQFVFRAVLAPKEEATFYVTTSCLPAPAEPIDWETAFAVGRAEYRGDSLERCNITSSNETFNNWVNRSAADLNTMIAGNPEEGYPYAGVPWFSTVFGRDGIITALQCLWMAPSIAQGVLTFLAEKQATHSDRASDADPGKILHEMRRGEMASLGEVPFALYYGSVDSTPLFLMLAGAYYERTGDLELISFLWPHIEAALNWIDRYGDGDGDGFVEYSRRSANGLVQQGWKDSHDSVYHADGTTAEPPIALCEVQGYVYAAKIASAQLANALGRTEQAIQLKVEADGLRAKFEQSFWSPEIGTYALALDGQKQQCRIRTSNAGQCLYTGIADPGHARTLAESLGGGDFFSGWGIRTVSSREVRYNPLSYHNGSIWPHDNALIASGLSRYGLKDLAGRVFSGLLDASAFMELQRLPELFCGLHRRTGEGPTLYPVACSPQAWAAGSVFQILESCLGLIVSGRKRRVVFEQPFLPEDLHQVSVRNLEVAGHRVDFSVERKGESVRVKVTENTGNIDIIVR